MAHAGIGAVTAGGTATFTRSGQHPTNASVWNFEYNVVETGSSSTIAIVCWTPPT